MSHKSPFPSIYSPSPLYDLEIHTPDKILYFSKLLMSVNSNVFNAMYGRSYSDKLEDSKKDFIKMEYLSHVVESALELIILKTSQTTTSGHNDITILDRKSIHEVIELGVFAEEYDFYSILQACDFTLGVATSFRKFTKDLFNAEVLNLLMLRQFTHFKTQIFDHPNELFTMNDIGDLFANTIKEFSVSAKLFFPLVKKWISANKNNRDHLQNVIDKATIESSSMEYDAYLLEFRQYLPEDSQKLITEKMLRNYVKECSHKFSRSPKKKTELDTLQKEISVLMKSDANGNASNAKNEIDDYLDFI